MSPEQRLVFDAFASVPMFIPAQNPSPRVKALLEDLPRLQESDLVKAGEREGACSVCYLPFLAILAEEEHASVMQSPAHPAEELGVTKLSKPWQCGHIFCRRDITKWIREGKDSCPMCRKTLLDPSLPAEDEGPRVDLFGGTPELEAFYWRMGFNATTRSPAATGSGPSDASSSRDSDDAYERPSDYSSMFS
ncbi:hypothetical protein BKA70DRAFT_1368778 [Coprinopsis sp. MPI-PUGE-AT-0042]|nr:hypothetical protein BKA70DRAFT_1368778 [Coprinopsis sp. MPI-PUGE-AT-0042]